MPDLRTVRVAVVQAAPALFDRAAGTDKACRLVREAAAAGARLVLLPEAYLPGYPRGLGFGTLVGGRTPAGRDLWRRYWEESVAVPGPTTEALGPPPARPTPSSAVGVIERDLGPLYCALLYLRPRRHAPRQAPEAQADGRRAVHLGRGRRDDAPRADTPVGRVGGLICWENYMPLARMALYQGGRGVPRPDGRRSRHVAGDLRHIACEGRCFVLGANQFVTRSLYPADLADELKDQPEIMCRGGSVIVSPLGELLAGPAWDREETLYAELDLDDVVRGKMDLDVVGHYARPDVFQLTVKPPRTDTP